MCVNIKVPLGIGSHGHSNVSHDAGEGVTKTPIVPVKTALVITQLGITALKIMASDTPGGMGEV